jgi:serpin B
MIALMRRRITSAVIALLVAASASGCAHAGGAQSVRTASDPPASAAGISPGKATEQLGLELLHRLGSGNLAFSPDSIAAAVAMLGSGASGKTAAQIAQVLHLRSVDDFAGVGELQRTIIAGQSFPSNGGSEAPILQIANGIFVQQGYPLEASFTDGLVQDFGAVPESVDFQGPAGTEAINAWVSQQTHGLIPKIFDELSPETRLALANAIYLKAKWSEHFKPSDSAPGPFHGQTGTSSTVFMHKTESLSYDHGRGYAAVALPYLDSSLSLLVVLPSGQSLSSFERQLNASALDRIVRRLSKRNVYVTLPRFHLHTQTVLNGVLQELGMSRAFSESAEFSKITKAEALKLGEVAHAADFKVNEEGTVAAASTVGTAELLMRIIHRDVVDFDADRPFLFFLRDERSGALLFAGRLVRPED